MPKEATNPVIWSLLTQGVTSARVDLHHLQHFLERAADLVESSDHREHIFEVAGDIVTGAPGKLESALRHLDRTLYALSALAQKEGKNQLPFEDRSQVDTAIHDGKCSASRVASQYLEAKLPLGFPGGTCHVVQRVHENVRNPRVRDELQDELESGQHLDKNEEKIVYDPVGIPGIRAPRTYPFFGKILLPEHPQYRADLRSVNENEIRIALRSFLQEFMDAKSRGDAMFHFWERAMRNGDRIEWTDPRIQLFLVFKATPRGILVITTYWKGEGDPKPTRNRCPV